jgi:hypothetical protein
VALGHPPTSSRFGALFHTASCLSRGHRNNWRFAQPPVGGFSRGNCPQPNSRIERVLDRGGRGPPSRSNRLCDSAPAGVLRMHRQRQRLGRRSALVRRPRLPGSPRSSPKHARSTQRPSSG